MKYGNKYANEMKKYPVINITLRDANQPNYRLSFVSIMMSITYGCRRHEYLMENDKLS